MRIIHITNTISERGGGIAASVANIARSQKNIGHDISIWAFSYSKKKLIEDILRGTYSDLASEIKVLNLQDLIGCLFMMLLGRKSLLCIELDSVDVMHRHGLWSPISLISFLINPELKNYFLSPHGFLNREALKISNYKKYFFSYLIERHTFKKSIALILSSEYEAEEVLRFSWARKKNISIIPNGVDDCFFEDEPIENRFIKLYENHSVIKHQFLYLGAIERIKGIDLLLEAINEISDIFRNKGYQLLCVGDGNKKYKNQLLNFIKQHSLDDIIKFQPGVYGKKRIKLYSESRFFVSISRSENFGITIAESLVLGVPVIVSSALPWGEISSAKAGILVEPNLESIKKGIITAFELTDIEYEEYCRSAIKFSNKKFRWDVIGSLLVKTYSSDISIKH